MSYANMDGVPTQTAGTSELLASDWNTYVRDNFDSIKFGHVVVADASARSGLGNVAEGVMVYQADNQKLYVNRNGTTADWVEVADLDNVGGASDTVQDYLDQYAYAGRNMLVNGNMLISQRKGTTSTTPANSDYTLDRWKIGCTQASKFTFQQSTTVPAGSGAGHSHSYLITSSSAYSITTSDEFEIFQPIEGYVFDRLAYGTADAKTATLSFWVRSSLTGTFGGCVYNYPTTNRSYTFSYTISAADTWEYKSVVIPGSTSGTWGSKTTSAGGAVLFSFGAGSTRTTTAGSWNNAFYPGPTGQTSLVGTNGATLYLTGVQFEAGDVATPFEFEPYETTLRKCQRYYYRHVNKGTGGEYEPIGMGSMYNTTEVQIFVNLPVTMRGEPSLEATSGSNVYTFYRNNASDAFDSLNLAEVFYNTAVLNNNTQISGTAGHAGMCYTNGGAGTATHVSFSAEL